MRLIGKENDKNINNYLQNANILNNNTMLQYVPNTGPIKKNLSQTAAQTLPHFWPRRKSKPKDLVPTSTRIPNDNRLIGKTG